ncbi:MAG TPA: hypothetical protein DIT97_11010, partial [Gimesia maris]|nr:hypothetical protein [Gimesia maris]
MKSSTKYSKHTYTFLLAWFLTSLSAVPAAEPVTQPVLKGVEQAHAELWDRFVDSYGIIHDFVGDLPTPED